MILDLIFYYVSAIFFFGISGSVLSIFGLSLGIRSKYTAFMEWIFEWIEKSSTKINVDNSDDEDETAARKKSSAFSSVNDDLFELAQNGMQVIATDLFTESQGLGQLPGWNMLTRTDQGLAWSSPRFTILWIFGFVVRWFIFFPVRAVILLFAVGFLVFSAIFVGMLPYGDFRTTLDHKMNTAFFRLLGRSVSLHVTFKNPENRPKNGSICVANHTSALDIVVLSNDNYYSLVGQKHKGFLGFLENTFQKVSHHIWFDRFQATDRQFTKNRLM